MDKAYSWAKELGIDRKEVIATEIWNAGYQRIDENQYHHDLLYWKNKYLKTLQWTQWMQIRQRN